MRLCWPENFLQGKRSVWITAAITFFLFLIANLPWQLDDYDQAKQAFTSFEMIKEGRWFYQYTPHEHVATKPPLIGWISAGLFSITRSWDIAWRLPSFLAAVSMAARQGRCAAPTAEGFRNSPAPLPIRAATERVVWLVAMGCFARDFFAVGNRRHSVYSRFFPRSCRARIRSAFCRDGPSSAAGLFLSAASVAQICALERADDRHRVCRSSFTGVAAALRISRNVARNFLAAFLECTRAGCTVACP